MAPPRVLLEVRFWPKVDVRGDDECWPWTAATFKDKPYGQFQVRAGEVERDHTGPVRAHRLAFRLIHGRWPEPCGLHGCDYPLCCNAMSLAHVHEGTHQQNMDERDERGRARRQEPVLAAPQVLEAQRLYAPGLVSYDDLAVQFGVSLTTIWRAVRGIAPYAERVV